MILLDAKGISASRPGRPLFEDINLTLRKGERLGVLGINGTGKSTLLRVLGGVDEPESGEIRRPAGVTVSFLEQNPELPSGPVRDAVPEGWEAEAVLDKLGMGDALDQDVSTLSGGQRRRVALAAALSTESDLLILDEPTNHLDIEAIWWLEDRIDAYRGALLLVTHDRLFLDRLTTRILELDRGTGHVHEGGYESYLSAKVKREDVAAKAEQVRKNLATRELEWLRRGPKARTSKSKARITSANALIEDRPDAAARAGELQLGGFGAARLGNKVVELHGVGHGYDGGPPLFSDVEMLLGPGERLGVIGVNGSGKSTLLDIIASRLSPSEGSVSLGKTVEIGYYDQIGVELDLEARVYDTVAGLGAGAARRDPVVISLLERFWFDTDAQMAPVGRLSGGERRRLQLLLVLREQPNVLLLDEPTNDLDLDTLRALEEFLDGFNGALVVASHDRAMLERTTDHVLVMEGDGVARRIAGGYPAWEAERRSGGGPGGSGKTKSKKKRKGGGSKNRSPSTLRRLVGDAELAMEKAAARRTKAEGEMTKAANDHTALASAAAVLEIAIRDVAKAEEEWLALSAELEDVEGR